MTFIRHITRSFFWHKTGNKADGIRFLNKKKFEIPQTYIIADHIRKAHVLNAKKIEKQLLHEIRLILSSKKAYAIRSSSLLEDTAKHSFAGQFKTFLNVRDEQTILNSILEVWQSGTEIVNSAYAEGLSVDNEYLKMGVIIQEMVQAEWSGVGFSINPVTGRHEIIIEGLQGKGEKLVQEGINPLRWIYNQGIWDSPKEEYHLKQEILEEIKEGIIKLKRWLRKEIDVEWAYDGEALYYLQCRAVTAQKYPTIYSNHISREFLPGMIKPLVWSINIPLVNGGWIQLLEEVMGNLDIQPQQLSKSFYYRAYFNMGTFGSLFQKLGLPEDALERLIVGKNTSEKNPTERSPFRPGLKTMQYLPRMIFFLMKNLSLGKRFKKDIVDLEYQIDQVKRELEEDFQIDQYTAYFKKIESLATQLAYYNIRIPLAMLILTALLNRKVKKYNIALDQFSFTKDFPELKKYDPQISINVLSQQWSSLPEKTRDVVKDHKDLQLNIKGLSVFKEHFEEVLLRYGHVSESGSDFSYPPWHEDPDFLLNAVKKEIFKHHEERSSSVKTSRLKKSRAYQIAGQFRVHRERISSAYAKGYGLFRVLFQHTGKHLTDRGIIENTMDVFYLTIEQHDTLVKSSKEIQETCKQKIKQVQKEIVTFKEILLPSVIYGELPPPFTKTNEKALKGVPVSSGIFSGPIVVVNGYADFEKEVEGKILVIPFSDVGWTPILSKAGAIVSESGGILSHASIVARELSIPAISSVDHACQLKDGTKGTLDGNHGTLILED